MNWRAAAESWEHAAFLELYGRPKHRTMKGVSAYWMLKQAALCWRRHEMSTYLEERDAVQSA